MKVITHTRLVFHAPIALAFALGLAGCGGNGGGSDPVPVAAPETGTIISAKEAVQGNCASLVKVTLVNTTISSATAVTPPFTTPDGKAGPVNPFCRVVGVSNPTSDSTINFEVWLPTGTGAAGWNGKFYSNTGSGSTGQIQYGNMVTGFGRNYAVKSTDLGHISKSGLLAADGVTVVPQGTDGSWAMGHPEKVIDWGYRAEHVTTVASKGIIQAFYGSAPRYSYFEGCSSGGHVGSMDASRYPDDFNGVISGAPNWYWTGMATGRLWSSIPSLKDRAAGDAFVTKLPALHTAVVAACDALDGLKDGLVDDPRKCSFDPSTMQCPAGTDALTCLTPAQVTMANIINGGPKRPNGQQIWPGFTWSGEAKWAGSVAGGATPGGSSFDFFRYWVYENPNYDNKTFNFDSDFDFTNNKVVVSGQTMDSVVNVKPEGINAFGARGGKMLMYHGWADDQVQVLGSIPFHSRVMAANNNSKPDAFYRLFLVPGMQHCSGGDGPDTFDKLAALEQWVELGIAPDQIIASKIVSGVTTRTRPLCPYPQVAKYKGTGSIDDAASFACTNPS